ncbi:hypothetical protein MUB15_06055 [Priestia sp. OVS21]|nr:hypothetical protein [Priestia sp. OVS21]
MDEVEGFIAIGWPGIGNLTDVPKEEIKELLAKKYGYDGSHLAYALGAVNAFIHTMQLEDIVLVKENNYVHIGKIGKYRYVEKYDNDTDGMCHQRSVEWLATVEKRDLNEKVQEHVDNRGTVTKFKHPTSMADIDMYIQNSSKNFNSTLDEETINLAIDVIKQQLHSADLDRRFHAAVELLRFVK